MEVENTNEMLNKNFSSLSEKNKKCIIEMTTLLVLAQNTIASEILNLENVSFSNKADQNGDSSE